MREICTIGYEAATPDGLVRSLERAGVDVLVDVRAVANSRRPGFAKSRLAESLASAGIEYLHLRGLGTPADGRAAARAGRYEEMRAAYAAHLGSSAARADLEIATDLLRSGRRICLLCLEARPEHCHRSLVASELVRRVSATIVHLDPAAGDDVRGAAPELGRSP